MYPANEFKFWTRVSKTDGCWEWTGAKTPQGYGNGSWVINGEKIALAHRVSYILKVGPIPADLVIDHLCRNPSCVRPDHLEPVTAYVNNHVRGKHWNREKDLCPKGHPLDYDDPRGWRGCRTCRDAASARYAAANPETRRANRRAKYAAAIAAGCTPAEASRRT